MKLPFSPEQFLDVFKNYNTGVFPFQALLYLLALTATYFTIAKHRWSTNIILGILAFLWLWMGLVYHISYFSTINAAANFMGALFILQGILFIAFKDKLSVKSSNDNSKITGAVMVFFALLIYPSIGYLLGHAYPYSPTFGLPCPTTIFTFGILLMNEKKIPIRLFVIPFLWSAVATMAVFYLGMSEDVALPAAAIVSLTLLYKRGKNAQTVRLRYE
jgi:hypothetical protein